MRVCLFSIRSVHRRLPVRMIMFARISLRAYSFSLNSDIVQEIKTHCHMRLCVMSS